MNTHGIVDYSRTIPGERGNYHRPVVVDVVDGYVGITQDKEGGTFERVLLSAKQWAEVVAFVNSKHPRKIRR